MGEITNKRNERENMRKKEGEMKGEKMIFHLGKWTERRRQD